MGRAARPAPTPDSRLHELRHRLLLRGRLPAALRNTSPRFCGFYRPCRRQSGPRASTPPSPGPGNVTSVAGGSADGRKVKGLEKGGSPHYLGGTNLVTWRPRKQRALPGCGQRRTLLAVTTDEGAVIEDPGSFRKQEKARTWGFPWAPGWEHTRWLCRHPDAGPGGPRGRGRPPFQAAAFVATRPGGCGNPGHAHAAGRGSRPPGLGRRPSRAAAPPVPVALGRPLGV